MRSDRVVVLAPLLDDDLGLVQTVEDFPVEAFVAQLAVEGFAIAIFPRTAGFNVQRLGAQRREPVAHHVRGHLRAVVGANVFRHTFGEHHIGHRLDDAKAVDPAGHPDRQAFPGELIDQRHQSEFATVVGLRLNEVVAPYMIAMLRSQPDAGSVVEPEPAPRPLLPRYFQPLTAPDPLNAVTADLPARLAKQRCDPTIAIPSVLGCKRDNRSRQRILISPDDRGVSLCPAVLADDPAGLAFRETILLPNALNRLPAPLGAYKFPEATSLAPASQATDRQPGA